MGTKLRVTFVADGVTLPDLYFDHPAFAGANVSFSMYAETPTLPGVTDKFSPTGTVAAGFVPVIKATGTYSPNDSHNPVNYTP